MRWSRHSRRLAEQGDPICCQYNFLILDYQWISSLVSAVVTRSSEPTVLSFLYDSDLPRILVREGLRQDVQQCCLVPCSHPHLEAPALADGISPVRLVLRCHFCCGLVRQAQDRDGFTLFARRIARCCLCRCFCYHSSMVLFWITLDLARTESLVLGLFFFLALSCSYSLLSCSPARCSITRSERGHSRVPSR
ncbi:hypothetical protein F5141DRAFT_240152 [Pisolithus sp. B1]|nr:hypothetical protein F5141DRAFT_240152 [Pisolithus sp. B1]